MVLLKPFAMQACKECHKHALIEDYQDGSIVCTNCGLVNCPFLLDDRPLVDTRRNETHEHYYDNAFEDDMLNYLEHAFAVPHTVLQAAAVKYKEEVIKHRIKGQNRLAMKAACIFWCIEDQKKSGQLYSLDDVGMACSVPLAKVHEMWKLLKPHAIQTQVPSRSKYHRLTVLLPNDVSVAKVLRECEALEATLTKHKDFVDKKPYKMMAAVFYTVCRPKYVACLSAKDVVNACGISMTTFKRHSQQIHCAFGNCVSK